MHDNEISKRRESKGGEGGRVLLTTLLRFSPILHLHWYLTAEVEYIGILRKVEEDLC